MTTAFARTILDAWEASAFREPNARAATMLRLAYPDHTEAQLLDVPLGQRDATLLEVRRRLVGPRLACLAACPACGEQVTFTTDTDALRVRHATCPPEGFRLEAGEYTLRHRLPNTADLVAAAAAGEAAAGRRVLVERLVSAAARGGESVHPADLPEEVVAALAAAVEALDPGAELAMNVTCPACEHRWQAVLDLGSFLFLEVSALARRLLYEVDVIARAYGWSEAEILSLSPRRRQAYVDLAVQ